MGFVCGNECEQVRIIVSEYVAGAPADPVSLVLFLSPHFSIPSSVLPSSFTSLQRSRPAFQEHIAPVCPYIASNNPYNYGRRVSQLMSGFYKPTNLALFALYRSRYRTSTLHNRSALLGPHEYYTPPSSGRSSPFSGSSAHGGNPFQQGQRFADDLEGQNDEALEGLSAKVKLLKNVSESLVCMLAVSRAGKSGGAECFGCRLRSG
jgi:hypothetical protein